MVLKTLCKPLLLVQGIPKQTLLIMKLTAIILLSACLTASANGFGQTISLSEKNAYLSEVFKKIEKQTNYTFAYTGSQLSQAKRVTVEINSGTLEQVLALCFKDQPFTYTIIENTIVVKPKIEGPNKQATSEPPPIDIKGRVVNENGEPVEGVTVTVKGTKNATATDVNGIFELKSVDENATLFFSGVNVESYEVKLEGKTDLATINLKTKIIQGLNVTVSTGYWQTTQRLNTGNISKVSSEVIGQQPVSNPLLALSGRVPGLLITQTTGFAGAGVNVQLRGQSSLLQGTQPFYVIDGVPYGPQNIPINLVPNATSTAGVSPFSLLNLSDIESIEILKDADATAIYGSRGANGVILITTKKGKAGKTKIDVNVYSSWSNVARSPTFLNTQQYVQMRKEAFINDGITPTLSTAPDLFAFDTTRYTDLKELLIGNTAVVTNVQLSVSGGNSNTQFMISGGFHRETTVFPTDLTDKKISTQFSLNHLSSNGKFSASLSSSFMFDKNELPGGFDPMTYLRYPPNMKIYDSLGKLNWSEKAVAFRTLSIVNPLSGLLAKYSGKNTNLISNLRLQYKIMNGLHIRTNIGYNQVNGDEINTNPSTTFDPTSGILPFSYFSNQARKSWIIEPQAEYSRNITDGKMNVLIGASWQDNSYNNTSVLAENYSSDILLNSIAGAGLATTSNSYSQYRYNGVYGRVGFNWKDKYIINLSGRRDGSSRFGPEKRFSNFGAVGLAWIFSEEEFIKNNLKFLNYGKIRGSYGITGNDQIGDYRYLDGWTASSNTYQGISSLNPSALFNPVYSWEKNRKLEMGLEFGIANNRVFFSADYFKNRSGNQLVTYTLPIQTGFASVLTNLDAVIRNSGFEFQLTTKNVSSRIFSWTTSFNLSIQRNKLLDFPGLANSSYASLYIIGEAVTARSKYIFIGVDPTTGLNQFQDINSDGILNKTDQVLMGDLTPKAFGGLSNTIEYKNFQLDVFFEFRKQDGYNYLFSLGNTPGFRYTNHPDMVQDRWQKPGDIANNQKYSASSSSPAIANFNSFLKNSDGVISDASFIRCKNISLSYNFPQGLLDRWHLARCRFYAEAQNVFLITDYKGADPENQNLFVFPPLRTVAAGIQLTF